MTAIEIYAVCITVAGLWLGLGWRQAHALLKALADMDAHQFKDFRPDLRRVLGMEGEK